MYPTVRTLVFDGLCIRFLATPAILACDFYTSAPSKKGSLTHALALQTYTLKHVKSETVPFPLEIIQTQVVVRCFSVSAILCKYNFRQMCRGVV